jgi:hypothetical protein
MDTDALYNTFTHPKVVTSMLLIGIVLGLALSMLMRMFQGQWFLPIAFAALALGIAVLYMAWLDQQEFRNELETDPRHEPGRGETKKPFSVFPASLPLMMDTARRSTIFTNPRVVRSMLFLGVGLCIALCLLIVLFRGTWYLPALVVAFTLGTVVAYLYWLDRQDFRNG